MLSAGDQALICYGVENARVVRIEPPVEKLTPAYNRCFAVRPERDTSYTLVVEGQGGQRISRTLSVSVRTVPDRPLGEEPGPPPLIASFAASATEAAPGQPVTICYHVAPGVAVRLDPPVAPSAPSSDKACFSVSPSQTTTYTLTASGPGGRTERQALTVRVQ